MTVPELRAKLLEGIDRILRHPFLLSAEDQEVLRAVRQTYEESDAVVQAILGHLLMREPK